MIKNRASIDIGTHTARLLIARVPEPGGRLQSLVRNRAYIRLGMGFNYSEGKTIQIEAVHRTIEVLKDFLGVIEEFNLHSIVAIATGVVREAANKEEFLNRIYDQTGISVRPITGDREAVLTGKGVMHALNVEDGPLLIFDLGGGSTEFLLKREGTTVVRSVPLGSVILRHAYLNSDPPEDDQIDALSRHIVRLLKEEVRLELIGSEDCFVAGTGGTLTTLTAMVHGFSLVGITAERINGSILTLGQLETLFDRIKAMSFEERLKLAGLDHDRADVIIAGSLVVINILRFFKLSRLTVSFSDLLEGMIIESIEREEKNG